MSFMNQALNQAFHLYRLQQIDTQISQVETSIAGLDQLLSGDETVFQAKAEVEETAKKLHLAQQNLKKAEFHVQEQQQKVALSEASLYSGKLRNPKEMQDQQKEIISLKKHLAVLEDRQLEAMMALEENETSDTAARAALNQAQASFAEKSAGWLGAREQQQRVLDRLRAERGAALSLIVPESLRAYEALRLRKSGVAVTTVKDGACSVCGAEIRPSEVQAARASHNIVFCTSCGRILYAG
jgi:uncharacterized protein